MSVLLAPCCCTGSDPCDTDWDFWNCCSGRRMFQDPLSSLPPYMKSTLGVQMSMSNTPPGPYLTSNNNGNPVKLDEIPLFMSCVGGRLNYGEPYPDDYDYFGAKVGNWGPPTGSGNILKRESDLRAFGSQFPSSFYSIGLNVYPQNATPRDILNGDVTPIDSGQYDRLEFRMFGPRFCGVQGCSEIASGSIIVSSADFGARFGVAVKFNRGTTRDGGLLPDCSPAPGMHPDFCPQCPQDLDPTTKLFSDRPSAYVKGNACGLPADIQAIIEASDPGSISEGWFLRQSRCSGGTHVFGGCTEGWYAESCEDETTTENGTIFAGYGECSCCPEDWDDQQISLQVIT